MSSLERPGLVVQKYGGSSLANAERIRASAQRIARAAASGRPVIVVVSAMGDTTDELIGLAYQIAARPDDREMDLLLSTGETVSATLVAMALHELKQPAVSLTGAQAGIRSTRVFSKARITDIHPERISSELDQGKVVIVTGFQGVTDEQDITTLGRGGSDTTAVALACALPRAVELGELYDMPIQVASSFTDVPGTLIHRVAVDGDTQMPMEIRRNVRGIAHDMDVARITLVRVADRPGVAAAIFQPLADANISVDTIAQSSGADGMTDMSFTVSRGSLERAIEITRELGPRIGAERIDPADDLAKVSIVGTGMQSAPGYAARMFGTLASAGINIGIISTSDIRITCVVPRDRAEDAVRLLHEAFELDRED